MPEHHRERRSQLRHSANQFQMISYGYPNNPFTLVDFSEQGMRLLGTVPIKPGEFQTFELNLSDLESGQTRIQINLLIIWCGVIKGSFNCGAKIIAEPRDLSRIYASLQNAQ